uniref:Uncharacterized protein n=1 Tax=Cannabis sativa TaxID=3483 RepID=A0A803PAC7_CANSA
MPVYAMSTNKIPLSCCRQQDALMRKYWWLGNVEKDRFLALKAWDRFRHEKLWGLKSGGLEDMNKALLTKLACFTKAVWLGGYYPLKIDCIPGDNMISFLEVLISALPLVERNELLNFVGCVFSEIWHQRNALCVRNTVADPFLALLRIDKPDWEIKNLCNCNAGDPRERVYDIELVTDQGVVMCPREEEVNHVIFTDANWINGDAGVAVVGVDRSNGCWFVMLERPINTLHLKLNLKPFFWPCLGLLKLVGKRYTSFQILC